VRSRGFLDGVGFLTTLGVGVGLFVRLRMSNWILFLHHTLKLGINVEMIQFLLKLLLKQISCCAPRFPLILTAKFHSLYVEKPEWEILDRPESDILDRPESDVLDRPESDILDRPESDILDRPEPDILDRPESEILNRPESEILTTLQPC